MTYLSLESQTELSTGLNLIYSLAHLKLKLKAMWPLFTKHFMVDLKVDLFLDGVGPLLFILYTTPISKIISQSSVCHHLCADDTQLFISFSSNDCSKNLKLLQTTISNLSSRMTKILLSLNPSKTESMLIIGLPKQLSKLNSPRLQLSSDTTVHPVETARNLGAIFDSNLSFSTHIASLSKSCLFQIRNLRLIRPFLTRKSAKSIILQPF